MIANLNPVQALVDGITPISVLMNEETEPVMFADGSYEMGKPYCEACRKDVVDNSIDHGTNLEIDGTDWYVIAKRQKRSGFYHMELSKTA